MTGEASTRTWRACLSIGLMANASRGPPLQVALGKLSDRRGRRRQAPVPNVRWGTSRRCPYRIAFPLAEALNDIRSLVKKQAPSRLRKLRSTLPDRESRHRMLVPAPSRVRVGGTVAVVSSTKVVFPTSRPLPTTNTRPMAIALTLQKQRNLYRRKGRARRPRRVETPTRKSLLCRNIRNTF